VERRITQFFAARAFLSVPTQARHKTGARLEGAGLHHRGNRRGGPMPGLLAAACPHIGAQTLTRMLFNGLDVLGLLPDALYLLAQAVDYVLRNVLVDILPSLKAMLFS